MIAVTWWSFAAIAALTLRVTVVLALAWVGAQIAFRRSAATRHAVWATAFVAALALPMAGRVLPVWSVAVLPPEAAPVAIPQEANEPASELATGGAALDARRSSPHRASASAGDCNPAVSIADGHPLDDASSGHRVSPPQPARMDAAGVARRRLCADGALRTQPRVGVCTRPASS